MPERPLADAVDRFLGDPGTTFTVPGHKRSPELADALLQLDLPLVSGAEDSRPTGDVLGRAERLAAQLWSADMCRFSVAGSTHGNQAFALAVARPGDRVIVAYTPEAALIGFGVLWWRPDGPPRDRRATRRLTDARPHLDAHDRDEPA